MFILDQLPFDIKNIIFSKLDQQDIYNLLSIRVEKVNNFLVDIPTRDFIISTVKPDAFDTAVNLYSVLRRKIRSIKLVFYEESRPQNHNALLQNERKNLDFRNKFARLPPLVLRYFAEKVDTFSTFDFLPVDFSHVAQADRFELNEIYTTEFLSFISKHFPGVKTIDFYANPYSEQMYWYDIYSVSNFIPAHTDKIADLRISSFIYSKAGQNFFIDKVSLLSNLEHQEFRAETSIESLQNDERIYDFYYWFVYDILPKIIKAVLTFGATIENLDIHFVFVKFQKFGNVIAMLPRLKNLAIKNETMKNDETETNTLPLSFFQAMNMAGANQLENLKIDIDIISGYDSYSSGLLHEFITKNMSPKVLSAEWLQLEITHRFDEVIHLARLTENKSLLINKYSAPAEFGEELVKSVVSLGYEHPRFTNEYLLRSFSWGA